MFDCWLTTAEFAGRTPIDVFHRESEPMPPGDHPRELRDLHYLVRGKIPISGKSSYKRLFLHITADDRYHLLIGGRRIATGPAPSYFFHYCWNRIDVTDLLTDGENTVELELFYSGLINRAEQSGDLRCGFALELYGMPARPSEDSVPLPTADGRRDKPGGTPSLLDRISECADPSCPPELSLRNGELLLARADRSWQYAPITAYLPAPTVGYDCQFAEFYDAGRARPDESDFRPCIQVPADYRYAEAPTPSVELSPLSPSRMLFDSDGGILCDFGREITAYPKIALRGPRGTRVHLLCGEELESGRVDIAPDERVRHRLRAGCDYHDILILSGKTDTVELSNYRAFRYLALRPDARPGKIVLSDGGTAETDGMSFFGEGPDHFAEEIDPTATCSTANPADARRSDLFFKNTVCGSSDAPEAPAGGAPDTSEAPAGGEATVVFSITATERHYPFDEDRCTLKSSDPILDAVFGLCKNAVRCGAQEQFVDCPTRERGQYSGDMTVTAHAHLLLTGDPTLSRKGLCDLLRSSTVCPGLLAVAPGSFMQEIADYSLQLPLLLMRDYRFTGDLDFLRSAVPYLDGMMNYFAGYAVPFGHYGSQESPRAAENGSESCPSEKSDTSDASEKGRPTLLADVTGKWNLVDWPAGLRDGYDFPLDRPVGRGMHNVLNAFYVGASIITEKIKETVGIPFEKCSDRLISDFNRTFFDDRAGLYRDSPTSNHSSLHSNVLPLFFGFAPRGYEDRIADFLLEKGLCCGVYFAYFLLKALCRAGRWSDCYALMTSTGANSWYNMVREGGTAAFEAWGKEAKWNTSLCHPWASAPIVIFIEDILGLSPDGSFCPHLPDGLTVSATLPLPDGRSITFDSSAISTRPDR